jgi:hypothetical protein
MTHSSDIGRASTEPGRSVHSSGIDSAHRPATAIRQVTLPDAGLVPARLPREHARSVAEWLDLIDRGHPGVDHDAGGRGQDDELPAPLSVHAVSLGAAAYACRRQRYSPPWWWPRGSGGGWPRPRRVRAQLTATSMLSLTRAPNGSPPDVSAQLVHESPAGERPAGGPGVDRRVAGHARREREQAADYRHETRGSRIGLGRAVRWPGRARRREIGGPFRLRVRGWRPSATGQYRSARSPAMRPSSTRHDTPGPLGGTSPAPVPGCLGTARPRTRGACETAVGNRLVTAGPRLAISPIHV